MSNLLSYKNYNGTVEYSKKDNCLFGKVVGIKSLLSYDGNSIKELEQDFQNVIDEYLADCKERNVEPEQPYSLFLTEESKYEKYYYKKSLKNKQFFLLSYCWFDEEIANTIANYLVLSFQIQKSAVKEWNSFDNIIEKIKEADGIFIVLTEAYFHSYNCMNVFSKIIKEIEICKKIYPIVLDSSIYTFEGQINKIIYWEHQNDKISLIKGRFKDKVYNSNMTNIMENIGEINNNIENIFKFITRHYSFANDEISKVLENVCYMNIKKKKNGKEKYELILKKSIEKILSEDYILLENNVHEITVSSLLSRYISMFLKSDSSSDRYLDVDIEYNRMLSIFGNSNIFDVINLLEFNEDTQINISKAITIMSLHSKQPSINDTFKKMLDQILFYISEERMIIIFYGWS